MSVTRSTTSPAPAVSATTAPAVMDAAIVGATGYVGAELLRLLSGHPTFRLGAAYARQGDLALAERFPHLAGVIDDVATTPLDALDDDVRGTDPLAIFFALPHGESARLVDRVLSKATRPLHVVDLSADFRHADPATYAAIYGAPHPAPARLAEFVCGLPDLEPATPAGPVAHPGCFTTAVTLAAAPLIARDLIEPHLVANAVTGSTGSGQTPSATTHHPDRHGGLRNYAPLTHRHRPEMESLLGRLTGAAPSVAFLPHSGPFARGIFATVTARLRSPLDADAIVAIARDFYASSTSVRVDAGTVSLKHVVGTNRCRLGIATDGRDVVVASAIDNLVKGAAGGAVHWMNRLAGLPADTGLTAPGLGWT